MTTTQASTPSPTLAKLTEALADAFPGVSRAAHAAACHLLADHTRELAELIGTPADRARLVRHANQLDAVAAEAVQR